ncbi:iron-containing alcohol dehydrogenase [Vagococcus sp. BWB3-3]|uniref:Iron-containing alcohol dehydrogenase n=1 Tax=Vagococcus allomyrinae TaxID=2794353 RepID=A0A940PAY7_9ENTE|nr:iron-containing alcohol dehydrogenase [Vagococcus allomyrinae]
MIINQFTLKTKIVMNQRSLETLKTISGHSALIVADKIMDQLGYLEKVKGYLAEAGIQSQIFSDVKPDPDTAVIAAGIKVYQEFKPDVMVAIGGGSAIDAAKGIFYAVQMSQEPLAKPYFIAIPSTSGTGSEVTDFSVITAADQKVVIVDDSLSPDLAILDSSCIDQLPQQVVVDTGLDVLTHATEAYVAINGTDFTDALAEKAIRLVFQHLPILYEDIGNDDSRDRVHNASCMAGIAFNNAGLGIVHSLSHAIGGRFHLPHGRCNGLLIEKVISYNAQLAGTAETKAAEKYAQLAKMLGLPARTIREGVVSYLDAISQLKTQLGVESGLSQLGLKEEDYQVAVPEMAKVALADRCTPTNPVSPTTAHLEAIYQMIY